MDAPDEILARWTWRLARATRKLQDRRAGSDLPEAKRLLGALDELTRAPARGERGATRQRRARAADPRGGRPPRFRGGLHADRAAADRPNARAPRDDPGGRERAGGQPAAPKQHSRKVPAPARRKRKQKAEQQKAQQQKTEKDKAPGGRGREEKPKKSEKPKPSAEPAARSPSARPAPVRLRPLLLLLGPASLVLAQEARQLGGEGIS